MSCYASRFANAAKRSLKCHHPNRIKPLPPCSIETNRQFSASANNDAPPKPNSPLSPLQTSLALSVHFLHPKLGMKDYEILSRATAFLVNVDPPEPSPEITNTTNTNNTGHQTKSSFPHLSTNKTLREDTLRKQDYAYTPASGPKRPASKLNWLEFCPTNFRPRVHVVASSHVLSPWRWPKYYGQEWLKMVDESHVRYSLEVMGRAGDSEDDRESEGQLNGEFGVVAKFELNPYPIHHPEELDVAVIHLKGEDEALEQMEKMGIQPLNLHTMYDLEQMTDPVFEPGEHVYFHGFEVYEANKADDETLSLEKESNNQEDERTFHPYSASGIQTFGSPDRFLAKTTTPLPEGLCGGPVLPMQHDKNQPFLKGVVEGIVPTNHENKELAGAASFLPSYRIREFIDFAERIMLEQIIEPDLFKRVVDIKEKNDHPHGTTFNPDEMESNSGKSTDNEPIQDPNVLAGMESISDDDETPHIDKQYQEIVSSLHKHHTPEEVDAILATVEREKKEVLEIMEKEGGDMDDVIRDVRRRTYEERDRVLKELSEMEVEEEERNESGVVDVDTVKKDKST